MGRMKDVKDGENILVTYGYNKDGTLKDKTYQSGIKTSYGYDNDNNITSIMTTKGTEAISSYAYEYYNNGYLKKETEDGQSTLYNYDGIGRLTNTTYSNGDVESFAYDKAGNRLTKTLKGTTTNYKYDVNNRLNELMENGKLTNFTYDKNGNMLSEQTTGEAPINFTYNKFNQLMEITKGNQYQKNYYEPLGLRSTTIENGFAFDYNYDRGSIISERNSGDKVTRTIRGLGLVAQKDAKDQTTFYLQNRHGDVTGIFDNTGKIVNRYSYDAFGQSKTSTETINNRFKYSGEQQDSITGHYYLRARFYNPVIGRFTQEDSYRGDGLNLYSYVRNNPVNFVDPSGHFRQTLNETSLDGGVSSSSRGSGVNSGSSGAGCSGEGYDYTGSSKEIYENLLILDALESIGEDIYGLVRVDKWGPDVAKMVKDNYSISPVIMTYNMKDEIGSIVKSEYNDFVNQVIKGDKHSIVRYGAKFVPDILDDIAAQSRGDASAAARLQARGDHLLTNRSSTGGQNYAGWNSVYITKTNGSPGVMRIFYKETSEGIKWQVVQWH